ncbi:hypothetical protein J5N97_013794 [Dioscorea zingiberensis]|uniref:Protein kinase domain-containing protein n=1 Tax=Dioscorea zingiberensis TaxID=325984 RepID=A0A9D5CR81_9LILI|nr:hypothetical protein J5N97_013794 [Dioscorea zingiberensis]
MADLLSFFFFFIALPLLQGLEGVSASPFNDEGMALLGFRERVELDPYGALVGWGEGGGRDPCSWFGIGCSDGRVVDLNLGNLRLKGTLSPEIGRLVLLKSLVLHNNSFYGDIPKEISELQKLEVLDLGYNNFSGLIPSHLSSMMSLETLILRSNKFLGSISMSELEVDEEPLSSNKGSITRSAENATIRRIMQVVSEDLIKAFASPSSSPSPSPASSPSPSAPSLSPSFSPSPVPVPSPLIEEKQQFDSNVLPPPHLPMPFSPKNHSPSVPPATEARHSSPLVIYIAVACGFSFLLVFSAIYVLCCRGNKVVTVGPWSTGLSGQLQKAFVTDGLPALRLSELETACEDFSNVIGSLSDCTLYKGTLSSGVEIAVTSSVIKSVKDWSKDAESQFRNKISALSRVTHKNFMNLLGYCEEDNPFTRMMVFEYAPNGTLFEHLHIKEAEHLDWSSRLRIAMGIAYCLEHMQQLEPPIAVRNLNSSSIYLTEDYAAKVSDIEFRYHAKEANSIKESLDNPLVAAPLPESKILVYKFGILLLEILSGRRPFSEDEGLLVRWASCYFNGRRPLKDMVDITLKSFREKDLGPLSELVNSCISRDPRKRPTMTEVADSLRRITSISPDAAAPRLSPLWWAELEILSTEAN